MRHVFSSQIESIGYEGDTETMYVEFKNRSVYRYKNIPFIIYQGLVTSRSPGSYLAKEIKSKYPYEKLESFLDRKSVV